MTSINCPCCGRGIDQTAGLQWNVLSRTLSGNGRATVLTPHRALIFDELWRALTAGRLVAKSRLMDILYANDINGGPESDNIISVQINHLRKCLSPFGLSIKGRIGYTLIALAAEAIAA